MMCRKLSPVAFCVATILLASLDLSAQNDSGPRLGPAAAGGSFPTLNSNEQALFNQASEVLQEIDSVSGTIAGEAGSGLGPTSTATVVRNVTRNRLPAEAVRDRTARRIQLQTHRLRSPRCIARQTPFLRSSPPTARCWKRDSSRMRMAHQTAACTISTPSRGARMLRIALSRSPTSTRR